VALAAVMGNYAGTAIMLNMVDQQLRPDQTPLLLTGLIGVRGCFNHHHYPSSIDRLGEGNR